jgi:uncharacterized small protein (DUF1192 family)
MKNRVPSFIKLPRNKRFNFKARYYDADKEELQQRIAVIKSEMEQEKTGNFDAEVARLKMEQSWKLNRTRKNHFNASNMRIAFIAGILVLFFYYYLYL